jgi:hypothetical protein
MVVRAFIAPKGVDTNADKGERALSDEKLHPDLDRFRTHRRL